jgi:hypothetical protein
MNNLPTSMPPIDIKDPRIRVTFPDVAMRIARDGPMYGVIILVGVLALKGTTDAMTSIVGAAVALLARSHPPPEHNPKSHLSGIVVIGAVSALGAACIAACT